ncbi:2-oxoglutarate and iron-dependent oxygenase domain-containing protein 3-like [Brevipalpus obovatus]|uniref:2-oxoglutarate and iron-dependent oxygenase domain-containing protein 3-like n=1 Tax=Brevipalpus obovatus TaxID=246614 RepID=UPI003D9E4A87
MVSYEYIFKLIDAKLTRRKIGSSVASTDDSSTVNSSSEKNGQKLSTKSNGNKKESCVIENSKSVATKRSRSSIILYFLNVFAIATLIAVLFYVVPWENWVFSEEELERLEHEGIEMQDFLATADQTYDEISIHEVPCIEKPYWREIKLNSFVERCGVIVVDNLLPPDQIRALQETAARVLDKVGDQSYSNRESINLQWVNLHNLFRRNLKKKVINKKDMGLIRNASEAARESISMAFGIPEEKLHFNMVSQFTRYRRLVKHTEFRHVDKVRSPALLFTSILWLSTSGLDFGGGHTDFLNGPGPEPFSPVTIEPKTGRFAAWTSGFENPHEVKELYWGNRLALIFAFTVSNKLGHESIDALRKWAINATGSDLGSSYK